MLKIILKKNVKIESASICLVFLDIFILEVDEWAFISPYRDEIKRLAESLSTMVSFDII